MRYNMNKFLYWFLQAIGVICQLYIISYIACAILYVNNMIDKFPFSTGVFFGVTNVICLILIYLVFIMMNVFTCIDKHENM